MRLCYSLIVVSVLWICRAQGETRKFKGSRGQSSTKRNKIVRKQHVPSSSFQTRKQYINDYGGGLLGNAGYGGVENQANFLGGGGNELTSQDDVGNTLQGAGLSLDSGLSSYGNENGLSSMSNDLENSIESTGGRQMIGNGLSQGGDAMLTGALSGATSLGGGAGMDQGLYDGLSTGLGGGSYGVGGNPGTTTAGEASVDGATVGDVGGGNIGGALDGIGGAIGDVGGNMGAIGGGTGVHLGTGGTGGGLGEIGNGGSIDGGIGGGLGDSLNDGQGGLNGISDGSLDDAMGIGGLGSRLTAGSKQTGMGGFGGLGGTLGGTLGGGSHLDMAGTGEDGTAIGNMAGMGSQQFPGDSQLSDAMDGNPAPPHQGLTSILPGKTVHAHVSDKPTGKRPAVSGPSVTAALKVQMEAQRNHQQRLKSLKLKLKTLRKKLEQLQKSSTKQDTISEGEGEENTTEMDTLNDLKKATEDAIKELHSDYPHLKKTQSAKKQETLGAKLKTVDFTAKETGDTLEELLRLLDPELQDKKRGQVDGKKRNITLLDVKAENKLTSLTKKAEDEVDKLAKQNPKQKSVIIKNGRNSTSNSAMKSDKKVASSPAKGPSLLQNKLRAALLKLGEMNSTQVKRRIKFKSLGCWRDDPSRVVPSLENTSPLLETGYRVRENSIKKCAKVAKEHGFIGFAVENGGQCFGGLSLLKRYKMYGKSNDCAKDGRGGDYAMEVYIFSE